MRRHTRKQLPHNIRKNPFEALSALGHEGEGKGSGGVEDRAGDPTGGAGTLNGMKKLSRRKSFPRDNTCFIVLSRGKLFPRERF